jgi:hypothetical protein
MITCTIGTGAYSVFQRELDEEWNEKRIIELYNRYQFSWDDKLLYNGQGMKGEIREESEIDMHVICIILAQHNVNKVDFYFSLSILNQFWELFHFTTTIFSYFYDN